MQGYPKECHENGRSKEFNSNIPKLYHFSDDAYNKIVFFNAIIQHSAAKVRKSLDKGIDPNCLNADGNAALHLIAEIGDVRVGKALIQNPKTNVNIQTVTGITPLMNATICNRRKVNKNLLIFFYTSSSTRI